MSVNCDSASKIKLHNETGFTIVEALVSMVILVFVMLGLLQAITIASDVTLKNEIRDEAIHTATEEMEATRDANFDSVLTGTCEKCTSPNTFTRQYRNTSINYTINKVVTLLGADNKRVDITLTWSLKGETSTYAASTLLSR
ncbi:MAG: prepilin-type N-terminal cleavage/methylation domain-containing protein [Nitrospirae bacterium]|nr:prepilin-type N-terminal cleavage/methylation domain-containing protein [Nitrospirota bacterium]